MHAVTRQPHVIVPSIIKRPVWSVGRSVGRSVWATIRWFWKEGNYPPRIPPPFPVNSRSPLN